MAGIIDIEQKRKELQDKNKVKQLNRILQDIELSKAVDEIYKQLQYMRDGLISIGEFKAIVYDKFMSLPAMKGSGGIEEFREGSHYITPEMRQRLIDKYSNISIRSMIKIAIVKKLPSGKYRLYSRKKGPDGKRKNLGTYDSLGAVKEREKAIQYFKHQADDMAHDKETEALDAVSKAARYLEEAGMVEKAKLLYNVMDALDGSLAEADTADFIPHAQSNPDNQGYMGGDGVGGGYSMFNAMAKLMITANKLDKNGHINEANELDNIIKALAEQANMFQKSILFEQLEGKRPKIEVSYVRNQNGKSISEQKKFDNLNDALKHFQEMQEDDTIDDLVFNVGKTNITSIDNQSAGQFQGLSDWYFYTDTYNGEPVRGL